MKTNNAIAMNVTADILFPVVDEYGMLCAEMAALKLRQDALKNTLVQTAKETGMSQMEGALFRVTVSQSERGTLDMEAVRAKLSPQFIVAHTTITDTTTVRCVSRTGKK
jgi:hypothetical protein